MCERLKMLRKLYTNMGWIQISLILCMFGLLKEFRPNEPFVTDYLTGPWKNFTQTEVMQDIYPIGTYSYLATLVLVFLLTDFLRYKPVIILSGIAGTTTFVTMILATTMPAFLFLEFTYGLFLSTEVAYYTYIYAKVDKEHYQAVSSYTRGAYLVGKFLSGVVAQVTTTFDILDYHQLVYLTVFGIGAATLWACLLPPVDKSLYFHRSEDSEEPETRRIQKFDKSCTSLPDFDCQFRTSQQTLQTDLSRRDPNIAGKFRRAYTYLWRDFVRAYTNGHVVKWSLWWAFATAGYLQIANYVQPLWQTAVEKDAKIYNGAVEAAYTIIGALAVFGVGKLRLNWPVLGEGILSIFSIVEAFIIVVASQSDNIWMQYGVYILFGVVYHTMITVASFEVAKNLPDESYGLVFGLNTLLALAFQSLMTFIVVSGTFFDLAVRTQFQVYAGYFMVLGIVFLLMAVYTMTKFFRSDQVFKLWLNEETATDVVQYESRGLSSGHENPS